MTRLAIAASLAITIAYGCGGEESSRPPAVPPVTARPVTVAAPPLEVEVRDAGSDLEDASREPPAPPKRVLPEPSFGAGEPLKPGDPHAFRLAAALRAMRATRSGGKILKMLSVVPDVIDAHAATGVDPFADGEWLLVYGSQVAVPGPNANVVKHARAQDAGAPPAASELFGVRDVLLRPQPGVIALVPGDRATELAAVLSKPVDLGLKQGELARVLVAEPAKLVRFLPAEVVRATVAVKSAPDGGLDASGEADCGDAAACKATAASLDDLVKKQNSVMVRIVLRGLLNGLAVRADGTKLKVTLHAGPDQVDAVLNLTRAELGLPAEDPSDQTHH